MAHRLDEIKSKEHWTSLESTIVHADSHGCVNLAYRAAQELNNMEYDLAKQRGVIETQAAELVRLRKIEKAAEFLAYALQTSAKDSLDAAALAEYEAVCTPQ